MNLKNRLLNEKNTPQRNILMNPVILSLSTDDIFFKEL